MRFARCLQSNLMQMSYISGNACTGNVCISLKTPSLSEEGLFSHCS